METNPISLRRLLLFDCIMRDSEFLQVEGISAYEQNDDFLILAF